MSAQLAHVPYQAPHVAPFQPAGLQGHVLHLNPGEALIARGDQIQRAFQVVHGALRSTRVDDQGRRQVLEFHLPGDIIGLEGATTAAGCIEAIIPTTVVVGRPHGRPPELSAADRAQYLARAARAAQNHVLLLGLREAEMRIGAFLLFIDARLGHDAETPLPMSRQDIADYLALTIETVSRRISSLVSKRLISRVAGGGVRINDRDRLARLAAVEDVAF